MNPLRYIDDLLNGITMYRLLLYGLGVIAAVAVLFGFLGTLSYSGWELLASAALLICVCYITNKLLAIITDAATNTESSLITALILFCIMTPSLTLGGLSELALAGLLAMASKYILAWRHKHLFNPAAIAPVIIGLAGLGGAVWWVGSKPMLPAVALLGALVIRKVRKIQVVLFFGIISGILITVIGSPSLLDFHQLFEFAKGSLTSWPTVFLGTIMLTEPSTMPPKRAYQFIYAAVVAILFSSELKIGPLAPTPELALVIGNLFSYLISPKFNLTLTLKEKIRVTDRLWELIFIPNRQPQFSSGQYMEWTLPHRHTDARGNRRTFTIASSPTEQEVRLGIKTYQPSSSYKTALLAMEPGGQLSAGQVNGNFTLPKDVRTKLLFVGGGIGVTPFRSMIKYLIDTNDGRDLVLIWAVSDKAELGYAADIFSHAEKFGVLVISLVSASLTPEQLLASVPDAVERHTYVSGPEAMVRNWQGLLHKAGVPYRQIKTDHFSGY